MGGTVCKSENNHKSVVSVTHSPEEVMKKNNCLILINTTYAYNEYFFEVDFHNMHCVSKNKRYLITYSLDYIVIWDLKLIKEGYTKKVSKNITDLLKFFLYEHKGNTIKINEKGVKMIYKRNKFISITFPGDNQALIAFCIKNIVEIYSITINNDITEPPDVRPIQTFSLYDIEIQSFHLSNTGNSLALREYDDDTSILRVYDTSPFRCKAAAPYGHMKLEIKEELNINSINSFNSSCNSNSVSVSEGASQSCSNSFQKNHIDLDDNHSVNGEVVGGESTNAFPNVYFSNDDMIIASADISKINKNKNLLFRSDGFVTYEPVGRLKYKEYYIKVISISNDNSIFCIGNDISEIHVFNLKTSELICKTVIDIENQVGISSLNFNSDDTMICYGTSEGDVGIIDFSKGEVIKQVRYESFSLEEDDKILKKYITQISFFHNYLVVSVMFDQKTKNFKDFNVLINVEKNLYNVKLT
jgi:hypothetical protein